MDVGEMTDEELVVAWQNGDTRAGAELFARHYESIARFFGNKIEAGQEDLIQDTFLACVEGVERYRGEGKFRNYLFGIANNKLRRHLRDRVRDNGRFTPPKLSVLAATRLSGTSYITRHRRCARLNIALRQLPIDTQMMLELHYWEGIPLQDIAEIVKQPACTVRTRMRRGRIRLAQLLACE
jgi:RNA polymerase sigma factor (sigma-70 family)